jgi:hypothetical protein
MYDISRQNEITLTRGDSLPITIKLYDANEDPFDTSACIVKFVLFNRYGSEPLLTKIFTDDELMLESEDTMHLSLGTYDYKVWVKTPDNFVATPIISTITLT